MINLCKKFFMYISFFMIVVTLRTAVIMIFVYSNLKSKVENNLIN